jgi:hypothetical protein
MKGTGKLRKTFDQNRGIGLIGKELWKTADYFLSVAIVVERLVRQR